MNDLDTRFLAFLVWGVGTMAVYTEVVRQRAAAHRIHHDRRSRRDFMSALALWSVSIASSVATAMVLFAAQSGLRGMFTAIALGAFTTAGIVMATERPTEGEGK